MSDLRCSRIWLWVDPRVRSPAILVFLEGGDAASSDCEIDFDIILLLFDVYLLCYCRSSPENILESRDILK